MAPRTPMVTYMDTAKRNDVTLDVGIVVERRPSAHPHGGEIWEAVAVLPGAGPAEWREIAREAGPNGAIVRYHAATLPLTLHRRETEALRENLSLAEPVVFVVLEEDDEIGAYPWRPHVVTLSPFEAQDYGDADALVFKLPLPEGLAALAAAFVEAHHVEEPFYKRKRDRVRVEDEKFGKVPIFEPGGRRSS